MFVFVKLVLFMLVYIRLLCFMLVYFMVFDLRYACLLCLTTSCLLIYFMFSSLCWSSLSLSTSFMVIWFMLVYVIHVLLQIFHHMPSMHVAVHILSVLRFTMFTFL